MVARRDETDQPVAHVIVVFNRRYGARLGSAGAIGLALGASTHQSLICTVSVWHAGDRRAASVLPSTSSTAGDAQLPAVLAGIHKPTHQLIAGNAHTTGIVDVEPFVVLTLSVAVFLADTAIASAPASTGDSPATPTTVAVGGLRGCATHSGLMDLA